MPAPALDEEPVLPPGFEDLLEFVPHWIGETAPERWDIRARATMAEITRFYEVLLSRSEAILDHFEPFLLDAMPSPTLRLFRLPLALAEIGRENWGDSGWKFVLYTVEPCKLKKKN